MAKLQRSQAPSAPHPLEVHDATLGLARGDVHPQINKQNTQAQAEALQMTEFCQR